MANFFSVSARIFTLLLAGALGIAAVVQSFGSNASMTATCGALALFALLISQMHLIESLSGFGIQAKIRKLDEAIDDADEVVEKLKKLAAIFSRLIVDNQARAGRMGGSVFRDRCATAREVRELLEQVGVPDAEVRSAMAPWARWMALDLAYGVINRIGKMQRAALSAAEHQGRKGVGGQADGLRTAHAEFERQYLNNPYFTDPAIYPERLYEISHAMPFGSEDDRRRVVGMIDTVAPFMRSILIEQKIPEPGKLLEDLERVASHPSFGDPLAWEESRLQEEER